MKRKDFIRNMSLMGAGISLAPWKLANAKPSIQRFRLPPASIHIPHANFATAEVEKLTIPAFDLECSVQIFMRNGINPCNDDLKVFSFRSDNQWMSISFTRTEERTIAGKIVGLDLNIDSFESEAFTISKV